MKCLVTGAAGFIGYHLSKRYLDMGYEVVGLDCLNDYYSVDLKKDRLARLQAYPAFAHVNIDLADRGAMADLFAVEKFDLVVNLAAQAGVRHSLDHPEDYIQSNIVGFANVLEGCRHNKVKHLVFASSSSVYGLNTKMPFSIHDNVDHPISLYAASKKIQRTDGPLLQPSVQSALHGATILYGVRAVGTPRHGLVSVYQGYC